MPCMTTKKEATRFAATANRSILWADQRHTFESPRHARPSAARHHPALLSGSGPQRLPDPTPPPALLSGSAPQRLAARGLGPPARGGLGAEPPDRGAGGAVGHAAVRAAPARHGAHGGGRDP